MFLAGGLIEDDQGTSALKKVGGLATSKPVIAVLFAFPRSASRVCPRSLASSPSWPSSMPVCRRVPT